MRHYTMQQAFDVNWDWFIVKKNERSAKEGRSHLQPIICKYRFDETAACERRCGIGLLIPNENYGPEMEDTGWVISLIARFGRERVGYDISDNARDFERDLQDSHDGARTFLDHRRKLIDLAKKYYLKLPWYQTDKEFWLALAKSIVSGQEIGLVMADFYGRVFRWGTARTKGGICATIYNLHYSCGMPDEQFVRLNEVVAQAVDQSKEVFRGPLFERYMFPLNAEGDKKRIAWCLKMSEESEFEE